MFTILYAKDYFENKPQDFYERECESAKEHGLNVLLYDDMDNRIVRQQYSDNGDINDTSCIYRGWQMTDTEYRTLLDNITKMGMVPFASFEEYVAAHKINNYIGALPNNTPVKTLLVPYPDCLDINIIRRQCEKLGIANNNGDVMIKDYVKSVYGHNHVNLNWTDSAIIAELGEIIKQRDKDFAGGLAFKTWCNQVKNQLRFIVFNHEIICFGKHGTELYDNCIENIPYELVSSVLIDSPFFIVDVAQNENNEWFVLECGDGQVSEFPAECIESFYENIKRSS